MDGYHMLTPEQQKQVKQRMLESPIEWEALNAPLEPDALVRRQWDTPAEPPDTLMMPLLP